MTAFNRSKSFNQKALSVGSPKSLSFGAVGSPRSLSFGNPRVTKLGALSYWFRVLVIIGSFLTFSIAICGGYLYVLPSISQVFNSSGTLKSDEGYCNVFDGDWVVNDYYPLYNASDCPFAEQGFNCLSNGRRDTDYLKWRWKPRNCDVPRINITDALERLRSKRVVFVGDSMSRTQWESLICLLMSDVEDKKSVYEVNQKRITKQTRHLSVRFNSFNFTVEFFRSVFLVQMAEKPKHSPRRVRSTLRLDVMDEISKEWVDSDILIFNSGHWWVPNKLFAMGCYFQVGNSLRLGMPIPAAYRLAIGTWASWVKKKIDTKRTRVFFRTFEPSHWSDQPRMSCNVTQFPTLATKGRDRTVFSETMIDVVKDMEVPVTVLNITSMSAFRSDAHVGQWNDNPQIADCSHWCLPGVPDMWNEILLSLLPY